MTGGMSIPTSTAGGIGTGIVGAAGAHGLAQETGASLEGLFDGGGIETSIASPGQPDGPVSEDEVPSFLGLAPGFAAEDDDALEAMHTSLVEPERGLEMAPHWRGSLDEAPAQHDYFAEMMNDPSGMYERYLTAADALFGRPVEQSIQEGLWQQQWEAANPDSQMNDLEPGEHAILVDTSPNRGNQAEIRRLLEQAVQMGLGQFQAPNR